MVFSSKVNIVAYVYFLIGPPASGKSTWRANFSAVQQQLGDDVVYVSSDDLIDEIAQSRGETYSTVFKDVIAECDRRAYDIFREAVSSGKNIVIDRTNMSVKSRNRYLSQVPKTYHRAAYIFEVPIPELKRRLQARAEQTGKHIPWFVVEGMLTSYQPPTGSEFDEISFVTQS